MTLYISIETTIKYFAALLVACAVWLSEVCMGQKACWPGQKWPGNKINGSGLYDNHEDREDTSHALQKLKIWRLLRGDR